jgi:hypothetical protein
LKPGFAQKRSPQETRGNEKGPKNRLATKEGFAAHSINEHGTKVPNQRAEKSQITLILR